MARYRSLAERGRSHSTLLVHVLANRPAISSTGAVCKQVGFEKGRRSRAAARHPRLRRGSARRLVPGWQSRAFALYGARVALAFAGQPCRLDDFLFLYPQGFQASWNIVAPDQRSNRSRQTKRGTRDRGVSNRSIYIPQFIEHRIRDDLRTIRLPAHPITIARATDHAALLERRMKHARSTREGGQRELPPPPCPPSPRLTPPPRAPSPALPQTTYRRATAPYRTPFPALPPTRLPASGRPTRQAASSSDTHRCGNCAAA